MGFWNTVTSAGPHANNLYLNPYTQFLQAGWSTWRPDVSKHWRQNNKHTLYYAEDAFKLVNIKIVFYNFTELSVGYILLMSAV